MRHASKQGKLHGTAGLVFILLMSFARASVAQLSLSQALLLQARGLSSQALTDTATPAAPVTTEAALRNLADQAAVIFRGEVLSIRTEANTVLIDFRVDDGIRGSTTGQTFTLREWGGLWTADSHRYYTGQRALFLLHEPSAGGFSSPVGGVDGIIPISGDDVSAAADLRWVAARVQRTVTTRADNAPDGVVSAAGTVYPAQGTVVANAAHLASASANGVAWAADATNGNVLGPDLRSIDSTLVAGLLRAWNSATATTAGSR